MQGRKKYLKFVAFVPAIVLVGGLVGYRAGAFERFTRSEPQPEAQPAANPRPAPEDDKTFMSGSKFARIDLSPPGGATSTETPPGAASPNPATPGKPPTFIYGSKSGPIELPIPMVPPGGDGKPAPNAPTPPQP
jgi:hypothetical protein